MNLLLNACINDEAFDKTGLETLSKVADEHCNKTGSVEVKPRCEVIEKCSIGERCCRLLHFKTDSRLELKTLEYDGEFSKKSSDPSSDRTVDVITYNNNPSVEYLLIGVQRTFPSLKVYDASNCSIREIFWGNFKWLTRLEFIYLANNKITAIEDFAKTFGYLSRMPLKFLDLGL